MYRSIRPQMGGSMTRATTLMSPAGINQRTAPQFLDPRNAINIVNYEIEDTGALIKRKGWTKLFEVAGSAPITMFKQWTDDVWIFGYSTTVARYTVSTDTVTTIKANFSANNGFDGTRYGEYFFVCNGVDEIWRVDFATFTPTEVVNSPICNGLVAIGPRLFAFNLSTDATAVKYSEVDTGANPPFTTWNVGTLSTDGGLVSYRNAGTARAVVPLGEAQVVFSDKGFYAFGITSIDVGGSLTKNDQIISYTEDFGGARGAISTEKGVFYANEAGLWNLVSIGQPNVPFSRQYGLVSTLLGNDYFENADFSNCDLIYDQKKGSIYLTYAQDSATNNSVLVYNTDFKAFSRFSSWNVSRWITVNGEVYAASDSKTAVYKCFDGFTDDGQIIGTDYYQELKLGDLQTRQMLKGCYVQGFLSASSTVYVKFDIYDITGKPIADKLRFSWTSQYNLNGFDGYSSAMYSGSAYGGDTDYANLVESFDGCRPFIRNFQRVRVHITSNDTTAHVLTWVMLDARVKADIRRRKMTLLT